MLIPWPAKNSEILPPGFHIAFLKRKNSFVSPQQTATEDVVDDDLNFAVFVVSATACKLV